MYVVNIQGERYLQPQTKLFHTQFESSLQRMLTEYSLRCLCKGQGHKNLKKLSIYFIALKIPPENSSFIHVHLDMNSFYTFKLFYFILFFFCSLLSVFIRITFYSTFCHAGLLFRLYVNNMESS